MVNAVQGYVVESKGGQLIIILLLLWNGKSGGPKSPLCMHLHGKRITFESDRIANTEDKSKDIAVALKMLGEDE